MSYEVWVTGKDLKGLVKKYHFKIQAIIYCFLSGYVSTGRGWYFLNPNVEIIEVKNEHS